MVRWMDRRLPVALLIELSSRKSGNISNMYKCVYIDR